MTKLTGLLLVLACLFAGICIGFLVSPIKKGIYNIGGNYIGSKL